MYSQDFYFFFFKHISLEQVIEVFKSWFDNHSKPKMLMSDNGKQYVYRAFKLFLKQEGVNHILILPYTFNFNRIYERLNKQYLLYWQYQKYKTSRKLLSEFKMLLPCTTATCSSLEIVPKYFY